MNARRQIAVLALASLCACDRSGETPSPGTLLFLTDFGARDGAVAACKGVMWGIDPRLRVVDLTHEIPAYDIAAAAEVVEQALPFYDSGTVVVAVVDPGVGGQRKPLAIRTKSGHLLVGPDNGIFTLVLATEGLDRAVELRNSRYFRKSDASYTFHGRDIFAPVGAHLASGVPIDSLGPPIVPVRLDLHPARAAGGTITASVRYVEDPYGNVVTDIPSALMGSIGVRVGDTLDVRFGSRRQRLPWRNTFSDVPRGAPLALLHSRDLLSFSINQGDFAGRFGVKRGDSVTVSRIP